MARPKQPAGLTLKVANIIPGNLTALKGCHPQMDLQRALSARHHPSRFTEDAVVAHVIGNMEDEGLNI